MKRLTILFSILIQISAGNQLRAQTGLISGTIRDAKTQKPLAFANIFMNKTTIGAVADESGTFTIHNVPVGTYEIVGSFIGYTSYRSNIEIKEGEVLHLDIKLNSEVKALAAVNVVAKTDKEWAKNLKKFKQVFLGERKEAKECRIVNPWVLDFENKKIKGKKQLTANASQPLEIENRYLGYRLFYYLRHFSSEGGIHSITGYSFLGDQRFEELISKDSSIVKQWKKNRMEAYLGSYRHLFEAILSHRVKDEGFDLFFESEVKKDVFNPKSIPTTALVSLDPSKMTVNRWGESQYYIQLMKTEVHYKRKRSSEESLLSAYNLEVSWLIPKNGFLIFDSNGIVLNSSDLAVSGAMFEKRAASHLPYDFQPAPINK